ncbi:MAG TPA: DUF1343 domain-containing protein [Gemmatimonadales bacterium]|jgi:uncharacterized protein YbbC (DUF1343 family)|nr:DUF1343 domain-containing protein [Gemmatimonadales bacterium]
MHKALVLLGLCWWMLGCAAPAPGSAVPPVVRPAIDVLLDDSLVLVRDKRVGLLTNPAGVDAHRVPTLARLRAAGVEVTTLFGPEHGLAGRIDVNTPVGQGQVVDSATGLPVYTLHTGERPIAPTPEMLAQVDVMVVDLQDVGARYYSYTVSTALVMEAAATARIPVVVLDRPDPIGGLVQGNVLPGVTPSAVARFPLAMRHGMTLGEVSRLARSVLGLTTELHVVPVEGWRRTMTLEETGLPFVPPSINLRTVESLFHYPGLCLFEGTNLSVGRGSDAPFEQIGAPWLDTAAVLARLRRASLGGVRFRGVSFTPRRPGDAKYADTLLSGIRLEVTDRAIYDPTATAVHLLAALRAQHHEQFAWIAPRFDRLAGGPALREAIDAGQDPASIVRGWAPELERFRERRRPFLLYPER